MDLAYFCIKFAQGLAVELSYVPCWRQFGFLGFWSFEPFWLKVALSASTPARVRVGTRLLVVSARWWTVMAKVFLAPVAQNLCASWCRWRSRPSSGALRWWQTRCWSSSTRVSFIGCFSCCLDSIGIHVPCHSSPRCALRGARFRCCIVGLGAAARLRRLGAHQVALVSLCRCGADACCEVGHCGCEEAEPPTSSSVGSSALAVRWRGAWHSASYSGHFGFAIWAAVDSLV